MFLASTAFGEIESAKSIPFLSSLPIMGQLFTMPQTNHTIAPMPTERAQSIPLLSNLPFIGRLFQMTNEATLKTK